MVKRRIKTAILIVVAVVTFSCTTLGKPIEQLFVARDNINAHNCIGIVTYKVPKWEYRFIQSNRDNTDIVIDGTIKNVFNTTTVDVTFDDFTIKGSLEYKHHLVGNDIVVNLNDGKIAGTIKINGENEVWDVMIYDKPLRGSKHSVRLDSQYKMRFGTDEVKGSTNDIFMGVNLDLYIGAKHIYGQIKNAVGNSKYLLNSDDLTEEDVMAYFVLDVVRMLRDLENSRR